MAASESEPSQSGSVKLPYFHRVLSEEDQKLIGDIAPKKIESTSNSSSEAPSTKSIASSSAWNQGTTWEERNCTKWAKETITRLFKAKETIPTATSKVTIHTASEFAGNVQITHSRGKPRYLYEMSFELKVEVLEGSSTSPVVGIKLKVVDAVNDLLDDMELNLEWGEKRPSTATVNEVKSSLRTSIRAYILQTLKKFEEEFRAL